jgi:hypothetical protein
MNSTPCVSLDLTDSVAIAGFEVLERIGQAEAARTRLLQILEEGNEDPTGFSAPAAT